MIGAAFDLATRTGYSYGEAGKQPCSGTIDLPGFSDKNLARSMGGIYSTVRALVQANGVKIVAIEAPLRGITRKNKKGFNSPVSAHGEGALTMLAGAAIAGASNAGAFVLPPVAPNTWRSEIYGKGNAYPDDPKGMALDYCNKLMKWGIDDHNAAEAACILVWCHGQAKLKEWAEGCS